MLVRIGDNFFNTDDVYHAKVIQGDELKADVILRRDGESKDLSFSGGDAEYLQTVLDAQHVISIQNIRDALPNTL